MARTVACSRDTALVNLCRLAKTPLVVMCPTAAPARSVPAAVAVVLRTAPPERRRVRIRVYAVLVRIAEVLLPASADEETSVREGNGGIVPSAVEFGGVGSWPSPLLLPSSVKSTKQS